MIKVLKIFQYHQNIINKLIFISLAILLLNQNCFAKPVQIFYPDLPEKIDIFIDKNKIKKYYLLLAEIIAEKKIIGKEKKKNLKQKLFMNVSEKKNI